MPLAAICPNCKTRYQLPDTFAGKAVQCKKCSQTFTVPGQAAAVAGAQGQRAPAQRAPGQRAPGQRAPGQRAPGQRAPVNPSGQPAAPVARPQVPSVAPEKLRQFGLDGPIQIPGELFNEGPPPNANPLGNHIVADPGFVMPEYEEEETQRPVDDVTAMLENPHIRHQAKIRGKISDLKPEDYSLSRIGLKLVLFGWLAVCLPTATLFLAGLVLGLLGLIGVAITQQVAYVLFIAVMVANGLMTLGLLGIFVGTCICIAAPNSNEKLFAILTLGAMIGGFALIITGFVFGAAAGENFIALATAFLLISLGYLLPFAAPILSTLYCRSIGRNINSASIQRAAKDALFAQIIFIISIFVFFGALFGGAAFAGILSGGPEGAAPELQIGMRIYFLMLTLIFVMVLIFAIMQYLKLLNTTTEKLKA